MRGRVNVIEKTSKYLLKRTRAKAKMIEYSVPKNDHINLDPEAQKLFLIAVAAIGNISASILNNLSNDSINEKLIDEAKAELAFASIFFDAYLNTELDKGADDYYLLFGAIAYYLCDNIGSSKVLINKIFRAPHNIHASGVERAVIALLCDDFHTDYTKKNGGKYDKYLNRFKEELRSFYKGGKQPDIKHILEFRRFIYDCGSDIELLLGDAFGAIFLLKIQHSAVHLLPRYMDQKAKKLKGLLLNSRSIKELWPSQRKIGESGVFKGTSAVIQMPTSAGKTKSLSLIIASSFLSKRTKLAIVVAPYRALCREISAALQEDFSFDDTIYINELSDVLQQEELQWDSEEMPKKIVLISTPEKLIYLLRQQNDFINQIGLIIFDEGHLFDDSSRGIGYELLLSTVRHRLKDDVQKVLVSAIIPNSVEINNWLNDGNGVVVSDSTMQVTPKNIAITDWNSPPYAPRSKYGYLYFLNPEDPEDEEFYVPRVISIEELNKKKKEKIRIFPEVNFKQSTVKNNDLAIYLSLKLCRNGGVAIFCGKPASANKILERIIEIEKRGYYIGSFLENSEKDEVRKICNLIEENYGNDNIYYKAATNAAFVHHAGISNGIKISLEHGMRMRKINFIVCTSTLAQGVNLPIRYLVVSTVYQGKDLIRVRDFHNLIGRAGRTGFFTEGDIIFTESFVYNGGQNHWKWNNYKKLINSDNSEPCTSRILSLVQPYVVKSGKNQHKIPTKKIIKSYYHDSEVFNEKVSTFIGKYEKEDQYDIQYKIDDILKSLGAIESFLMAYLFDDTWEQCEKNVQDIVKETLAYNLASIEEKEQLQQLFELISKYCIDNIPTAYQRYVCSKSFLNVKKMLYIQSWVELNLTAIRDCKTTNELLHCVLECLIHSIESELKFKFVNIDQILLIAKNWIKGDSYKQILQYCMNDSLMIKKKKKIKPIALDDIVAFCDDVLSYHTTVALSAVCEIVKEKWDERHDITTIFTQLSSELKYGLPYGYPVMFYEMGFSDRVICQKIADYFLRRKKIKSKDQARKKLKKHYENIYKILEDYPSVYTDKLDEIARQISRS